VDGRRGKVNEIHKQKRGKGGEMKINIHKGGNKSSSTPVSRSKGGKRSRKGTRSLKRGRGGIIRETGNDTAVRSGGDATKKRRGGGCCMIGREKKKKRNVGLRDYRVRGK